jgi:hypothetical protein
MPDSDNTEASLTTLEGRVIRRLARSRPRKALPSGRVSFPKQLDILRAAAVASGEERKPVSNEDVAKVVNIHFGSVSNCNPFFLEIGFLTKNKLQNVPCDEVFAFAERFEWEQEKAAYKLAPVIRKSWFCATLLPKLAFRPLSMDDAVSFLADEAGAPPEYKDQLSMLIDFMRASGIVLVENGTISLNKNVQEIELGRPGGAQVEQSSIGPASPQKTNDDRKQNLAGDSKRHPFVDGLLKTLPEPGEEWSIAGRVKWLQAASNIFGLIYTTKDEDDVEFIDIERKKL